MDAHQVGIREGLAISKLSRALFLVVSHPTSYDWSRDVVDASFCLPTGQQSLPREDDEGDKKVKKSAWYFVFFVRSNEDNALFFYYFIIIILYPIIRKSAQWTYAVPLAGDDSL